VGSSDSPLDIHVHISFDRFDFCVIALLPDRTPQLDETAEANYEDGTLQLVAQEEWYQDLVFEKIGAYLKNGLELRASLADGRRTRWVLRGRSIYVLASHPHASAYVSTNRLVLGRSHLVLCTIDTVTKVESLLNESGCQTYDASDQSLGVPPGWVLLCNVVPTKPIILDAGIDEFYALKPAPDVEIDLEQGIRIRNSVWLAGYPPRIHLFGQIDGTAKITIDGKEALRTTEGVLSVDGFDSPGKHTVYCEGFSCSCSYSIEEPPDSWPEWAAHHFGQADICGPLVRLAPEAANRRVVTVPMSNPLLIGAEPGQIFRCSPRRVANWKGFVPFDVVWALPAHPLISDKKTARILLIAFAPLVLPKKPARRALGWSIAILDASRKGLRLEDSSPEAAVLWRQYRKSARNIWRATR
jgi:hypothetical protein